MKWAGFLFWGGFLVLLIGAESNDLIVLVTTKVLGIITMALSGALYESWEIHEQIEKERGRIHRRSVRKGGG